MVTKAPVSITWSSLDPDTWYKIVLVNPSECIMVNIPGKSLIIQYKAYWDNPYIPDTEDKVFDMTFPYKKFRRALKSVNRELRQPENPVRFEFMKSTKKGMLVRNWEVLEHIS